MHTLYDVIIIGGGPAGLACAIKLKGSGLKVALFEKGHYPKQEVCGDGLTEDVLRQLPKLSQDLAARFFSSKESTRIRKIDVKYDSVKSTRFILNENSAFENRLHTCPRAHFDTLLFEEAQKSTEVEFYLDCKVNKVEYGTSDVEVQTEGGNFKAKMVVAADGASSVALRHPAVEKDPIKNGTELSPAVQAYYSGVEGVEPDSIRIFFIKSIVPAYFWIFPLADGRYNVGMGMTKKKAAKSKTDVRGLMDELIQTHPDLVPLFKKAERLTAIKGRPIAGFTKKHVMSGERFLLSGDAGNVVNGFTGEGIGNAIRCGRFAAETVIEAVKQENFNADFLGRYDHQFYKVSTHELFLSNLAMWIFKYSLPSRILMGLSRFIYRKQLA